MYGKVTRYFQDKGYGFILGEDGNSYFIHRSNLGGEYLARRINNMNDLQKALQPVMAKMVDALADRVYETLNYYLNDYYTGWIPDSYRRTEAFLRSAACQ